MKIEKTLRQRFMTNFLLAMLVPLIIFAVFSQLNIRSSVNKNLSDRIESNLRYEQMSLNMVLDKYTTILHDLCTDEEVLDSAAALNEDAGGWDENSSILQRKLSHVCNQNTGIEGITIRLANGRILFYDRRNSSWENSMWADAVQIPEIENETMYRGNAEPVDWNGKKFYLFYIAEKLNDQRDGRYDWGTVVLSVNEEMLREVMMSDVDSSAYLLSDGVIISAPYSEDIGKNIEEIKDKKNYRYTTVKNQVSGFEICNEHPLEEYRRTLTNQWTFLAGVMILSVTIMAVMIYMMSRPYQQAADAFLEMINRVEHGDFSNEVRIEKSMPLEIRQIGSGLNEMVQHLDDLIRQVKQAVVEQKNAEIAALEAQIDPHFLYNTLDTINWKAIENEQYEISEMLGALADILRYTVRNSGGTASIQQEIDWLYQYIMLQSAKLGKRLDVKVSVPEELTGCRIHKLLIQPFVENAIKHAFTEKEDDCVLRIRITGNREQIHIMIRDNGNGIPEKILKELNKEDGELEGHLGITNVKKRLKLYYGNQAVVYFESEQGQYTKLHLFIPAEEE